MKVERVPDPLLLITGTTGAGKSTVAAEINDTLTAPKVPNAAVEVRADQPPEPLAVEGHPRVPYGIRPDDHAREERR